MTDAEWKAFQRAMDEQREEILQALAEELGGDPEDYRTGTGRPVDASEGVLGPGHVLHTNGSARIGSAGRIGDQE